MIILLSSAYLFALLAFGFCVWFVVKDRNFWRNEYQTRDRDGREREYQLFDQLLKVKGFRTVSEPLTSQPAPLRPSLSADDLEIITDRINERVEMGIMTASEGMLLSTEAMNGKKTTGEIDRILWQRQKRERDGSVMDDV